MQSIKSNLKIILQILFFLSFLCNQLLAQGITIGSCTDLTCGQAYISLSGNWSNSGRFTAGTSTVVFNGSSNNQTISTSDGESFYNIRVNKTSGDVQLLSNINASGTVTIVSGDIDLNGNVLSLGAAGTLIESAGNTVKGTSGTITATRTLNAPSSENVAGMGAEITSAANLGSTSITRGHGVQGVNTNHILRYFDITPNTNTNLNAVLVFRYDDSELNTLTESELILFKSTDQGAIWMQMGGTINTTINTVTLTGIDGFSRWTLGGPYTPEEYISTLEKRIKQLVNTGVLNEGQGNAYITKLDFALLEIDNRRFRVAINILRAFINQVNSFVTEGILTEAEGQELILAAEDIIERINNSLPKRGNDNASKEIPAQFTLEQNYPNPFNPNTTIKYQIPELSSVTLKVFDVLGNEVAILVNEEKQPRSYEVEFDGSGLASGLYFYKIQAGEFVETKKMILMK